MRQSYSLYILLFCLFYQVSANNYLDFAWATYLQANGELPQALVRYQDILHHAHNPSILKGYFQLLASNRQWNAMVHMRGAVDKHLIDDAQTQLLMAQAFANLGNGAECDHILFSMQTKFPGNADITLNAVQAYLRSKEVDNALLAIDSYLAKSPEKPNNFIFYFMKSQIYVLLNKATDALKAVEKSIELYNRFDKSWLMYALLQEQLGDIKKALTGYISFIRETRDPIHDIQKHINKLVSTHNIPLASIANPESCSERICALIGQKKYDEATQTALDFLKQNPHDEEVKLLAIDSMIGTKHYEKAIALLAQWIQDNPQKELWFRTLYWIGQHTKNWSSILAAFNAATKKNPHNLLSHLYSSDVLLLLHRDADALHSLAKARALADIPGIKATILYQIALIQYKKRNFHQAKQCLKEACALPTTYGPAFNLLAYYTASKEEDIEKAEDLIKQALSIDPNNPHYLDTRAYIFYKASEYDNALPVFQQALTLAPQDATIKRHMAKTYYALHNNEKALSLLDEVITMTQDDTVLKKLQKVRDSWKLKKH